MRRLSITVIAGVAVLLGACSGSDEASVNAWPANVPTGATVSEVSEVSDMLPSVERQVGENGPRRPFLEDPLNGIILRGRVTEVAPWYSVTGSPADEGDSIADSGERRIAPYGAPDAMWSNVLLSIEVGDDYGAEGFSADKLVAHARGVAEEFEPYLDRDVVLIVGRGISYVATNGDSRETEWAIGTINPIADDGEIDWHESLTAGRSTTIDTLERIAAEGEVVVTVGDGIPPTVVERRSKASG